MIRFVFLLSMVACAYGCRQRDIPEEFERDILGMPDRMLVDNFELFCHDLFERIDAHTNVAVRCACYEMIWNTVDRININGKSGKEASRLIEYGEYCLGSANYHLYKNGLSRTTAIANIFECFRWMKKQGDRLQPTHRIEYGEMDAESRRRYDEWRGAYLACRYHLNVQIRMFEWHFTEKQVLSLDGNFTEDELSKMRVEMEAFLGRPLRTIDQWRAMRNVDSDEIKAVKRKEVGPAWFARPSDPPVSFAPLEILPHAVRGR